MKYLALSLVGLLALAATPNQANAGGRGSWGVSFGVGFSNHNSWGGFGVRYHERNNNWCGTSRYYGSYYRSYPRVYAPPPVVYAPPPVVYAPPVYSPPPAIYAPPPVVYSPPVYYPQYYPRQHYYGGGYYCR